MWEGGGEGRGGPDAEDEEGDSEAQEETGRGKMSGRCLGGGEGGGGVLVCGEKVPTKDSRITRRESTCKKVSPFCFFKNSELRH